MPGPCTIARTDDLGLGRLRWSLGELADAVTGLIAVPAAANWPPPARRHGLRAAVIAGAAMAAILLGCGAVAATAAFHSPARTLAGISWHGHHHARHRRELLKGQPLYVL